LGASSQSYEGLHLSNKAQRANDMIAIIVEYNVKSGFQDELQQRLDETCRKCLAEDGCTRMEVFAPDGAENTLVLSELWRDAASLVVHREQPNHAEEHEATDALCVSKRVLRGTLV
jgi:quinol monooxygenase YgiN